MRLITTIALALLGLTTWAQTSLPDLPAGALRYSQTLWIVPSDSTLWTGSAGNYAQVATREQLRTMAGQGYTKSQVDSAITSQIGLIDFPVTSVAGKTGDVGLDASDVGLGNVDNTTDLDKPISTATQGALDGKENAFSKGSLVAGTGVTLGGTTSNRLVGGGNVTISADIPDMDEYYTKTESNGRFFPIGDGNSVDIPVSSADLNSVSTTAFYSGSTGVNKPVGGGGYLLSMGINASTNRFRMYGTGANDRFFVSSASNPWYEVWTTKNFTPPVVFGSSTNGLVPSPGSGGVRYLNSNGGWTVPDGGGSGSTPTDLSIQNRTSTTLQIGSSTGASATMPQATTSLAGLLNAADKEKLNSLTAYTGGVGINIASGEISADQSWLDDRYYGFGMSNTTPATFSGDLQTIQTGVAYASSGATNRPTGATGYVWSLGINADENRVRIFVNNGVNRMFFTSGTSNWSEIWHQGNFTPSDYLTTANFTWSNLSGKPSTFAPSPHSHSAADINSGTLAAARIGNATVSNAKLANMGANTIKGRSGTTGVPQDLTAAQARTVMNVAETGTGASQTRTNSQLDGRYVQLTGSQSISGTKTFNSPTVAPQYQGTSTTASSSIPTNAQSLFKATINSNTNYTLTNLTGNPRQIQVMVTNTSGATVYVNFTGGVIRMADGASDSVPSSATVIFTFLIENGTAWGVKSTFL